jgi:DNA end-binding protein Ku
MPARSIASLTLSFGLVSIPVKLYSATESASDVSFNLMTEDGERVKQQLVTERSNHVVDRASLVKGYEYESDKYVVFTKDELKVLETSPSNVVEMQAFIPERSIDPVFYSKPYFIAPDKRGGKAYSLLQHALEETHRCAIALWASRGKTHVVQIRAIEGGLVFEQLAFADEVRSIADLHIEDAPVSEAELKLAVQIIEQGAQDTYDPTQFKDEEKARILAAIDEKIAGKAIVTREPVEVTPTGQVIDLMDALRASLAKGGAKPKAVTKQPAPAEVQTLPAKTRRPTKRVEPVQEAPAKTRARK